MDDFEIFLYLPYHRHQRGPIRAPTTARTWPHAWARGGSAQGRSGGEVYFPTRDIDSEQIYFPLLVILCLISHNYTTLSKKKAARLLANPETRNHARTFPRNPNSANFSRATTGTMSCTARAEKNYRAVVLLVVERLRGSVFIRCIFVYLTKLFIYELTNIIIIKKLYTLKTYFD